MQKKSFIIIHSHPIFIAGLEECSMQDRNNAHYYEKLIQRRREILGNIDTLDDVSQSLGDPGAEYETKAQHETSYQNLQQLDTQYRNEVQLIDRALNKIQLGEFGNCELCGQKISSQRLEAIPWTDRCIKCAESQQKTPQGSWSETESGIQSEGKLALNEYTDDELQEFVHEKLHEDARLDTLDLRVSCTDRMIHLSGSVADEQQYHVLAEILQDIIDPNNIIDRVQIRSAVNSGPSDSSLDPVDIIDDEKIWPGNENQ